MIMKNFCIAALLLLFSGTQTACNQDSNGKVVDHATDKTAQKQEEYSIAYFASGCFWCVEAVFESVKGVQEAISGYSGGEKPNPSYQEVSRGSTKHAEAVKVIYDPSEINFETLVDVFFASHDPTTLNSQGPDHGPQYRSIAFYQTNEQKEIISRAIRELEAKKEYAQPIVTEVQKFEKFWEAETYHQDYERKHPNNPYIQGVSIPRLNRFKAKLPQVLKEASH